MKKGKKLLFQYCLLLVGLFLFLGFTRDGGNSNNSFTPFTNTEIDLKSGAKEIESLRSSGSFKITRENNYPGERFEDIDIDSKAKELNIERDELNTIVNQVKADMNFEDPITDAISLQSINGQTNNEFYGVSVSGAGDVNGDGYDDIIVGAFGYSSNTGRAYIYHGSPSGIITSPATVLQGESNSNQFGFSVSDAGDLNGDGYADIIIGARNFNSSTGRVYIYYGSSSGINPNPAVILNGEGTNNHFGHSVSGAGDLNGNGYPDLIIGAPSYSSSTGRVYIYHNSPSGIDTIPAAELTGESTFNEFGRSVSSAGDVNGDGFDDVIIGANGYSGNTGRVYIFHGSSSGLITTPSKVLTGESTGSLFGWSVSSLGDVNGDGYSDVVVGAHGFNLSSGKVYVYHGSPNGISENPSTTLTGAGSGEEFGKSVSGTGDINGDGYSDLIVGSPNTNSATGKIYVFHGSTNGIKTNVASVKTGENASDFFGNSVSGIGDINGNGYSDYIVGAFGVNNLRGKVYIYKNSMTGIDIPDYVLTGESIGNEFGYSVAGAGDVNGDGYDDIIIGARAYNNGTGRAYIYHGSPSGINTTPAAVLTGQTTNNYFGFSVSGAGDVNGDGYDDVIVGANSWGGSIGRVYVYHGSPAGIVPTPATVLTGENVGSNFGESVSSAGDVNNDGYADIIIGAPEFNNTDGRVYIYRGSSSGINSVDVTILLGTPFSRFGISVSSAGDVNGDGFDDVIVGAFMHSNYKGRAYIYHGSNSFIYSGAILEGENTSDFFGYSVSGAGDVNGDGFADVVVGAFGHSQNTGKVYVYHGSLAGIDNNPATVLTGYGAVAGFGISVAGAGDVNGDGYDDIVVGTPYSNKVFVYFGGVSMSSLPDILYLNPGGQDDQFGRIVAGIGDINNDGLSDLIVGAPGYSSNTGRAYLYMSTAPIVKPNIVSVKDVPNDQGGFVHVRWMRSGYDVPNINKITDYLIERSRPPDHIGFSWEPVSTVPASFNPSYTFTSPTWSDSNFNGSQRVYFRITARTNNSIEFWRSNIVYGQSIDNLAPVPPIDLMAVTTQSTIDLEWARNTEPDLRNYRVYRNDSLIAEAFTNSFIDTIITPDSPAISPFINEADKSTGTLSFSDDRITSDESMLDNRASNNYTYRVSAVDINGNESDLSDPVQVNFAPFTNVSITIIPSGFYDPVNNRLNMSDTVKAYLVNASSPYNVVDSAVSVIDSITFIADFKFENADDGNYYLVIAHRNSLETWSKTGGLTYERGVDLNYNFTSSADQAYGSNMMQINGLWCIFSGDVNMNGIIDAVDRAMAWNERNKSGYYSEDVNGDGTVDAADRGIIWNNRNRSAITPGMLIRKQNEIITNDNVKKEIVR